MQGDGRRKSRRQGRAEPAAGQSPNQAEQYMWVQVLTLLNNLSELGQATLHLGPQFLQLRNAPMVLWQVVGEKHECFEIRYTEFKYWLPLALKPECISVSSFIKRG